MAPRWLRILLLAFQVVWLGAVLPGHTRGVVTLPGTGSDPCCASEPKVRQPSCCSDTGEESKDDSNDPAKRAARCAICFFAVRLTTPPPIDFYPAPLELLEQVSPEQVPAPVALQLTLAYLARGPPLAIPA